MFDSFRLATIPASDGSSSANLDGIMSVVRQNGYSTVHAHTHTQ
jgi:hypothetical protein